MMVRQGGLWISTLASVKVLSVSYTAVSNKILFKKVNKNSDCILSESPVILKILSLIQHLLVENCASGTVLGTYNMVENQTHKVLDPLEFMVYLLSHSPT